jgi:signal transduction histidine kinase
MFLLAVAMVVIGHVAARRWQRTADELSRSYEQGVVAERLRWAIVELAEDSMERFETDSIGAPLGSGLRVRVERFIETLRTGARLSTDSSLELDHISGLAEVYRDLRLAIDQIHASGASGRVAPSRERWTVRLQEITDEVDDAAMAMEQFFRERNRHSLEQADEIRRVAVTMTGAAVVLIAIQFLVMAVLLRRWVTRPVADLEAAADQIGAGRLELTLPLRTEREWRKVAEALHHMTRSLATLQQQLRVNERLSAIGEVAAYTAHNIRNPIASIRAMAQVGMVDAVGHPSLESTLTDIISCVDKMEQWIAGLLNFARPMQISAQPGELGGIAHAIYEFTEPSARSKGARLEFHPCVQKVPVLVDEALLEQAVYAIVSNAIDAVPTGGVVAISVGWPAGPTQSWATIVITDNGPGIPADMLPNVFKPFVTGKEGGSGLGLAQANKIIELHLGAIQIESKIGYGTKVVVKLPLSKE